MMFSSLTVVIYFLEPLIFSHSGSSGTLVERRSSVNDVASRRPSGKCPSIRMLSNFINLIKEAISGNLYHTQAFLSGRC